MRNETDELTSSEPCVPQLKAYARRETIEIGVTNLDTIAHKRRCARKFGGD
jgi:hypothetical protein